MTDVTTSTSVGNWAIAVHAGAGRVDFKPTPEQEAVYHAGLARALVAGRVVLAEG